MKVYNTLTEAMNYVRKAFGHLTMVSNDLETIENTFKTKGVCKVEGITIFVDELGILN